MESDQNQEAWKRLVYWYRKASGGKYPLLREHLDNIATKRAELYMCRPPEGLRVPILVTLTAIGDGIPEGDEVAQAV